MRQSNSRPSYQGLGEMGIDTAIKDQNISINTISDTPLNAIDIHVFADSGIIGTCAAAYAATHQSGHVNQHLIGSKS